MRFLASWKGWRSYRKLEPDWKKIVFYSESGADWHHFESLVRELLDVQAEKVCYVTSDPTDPGLRMAHPGYRSLCIPEGLGLIIHFQVQKAAVVVLTMMDLGNLQLKKSIHAVQYVYLFHGMGSTHMVDNAGSYDAYDTLFCVGPHHVAELRRREELTGMPARHLFEYGYPRLEALMAEAAGHHHSGISRAPPVVLVAPTWGDDSIFNRCGERLLRILLEAGFDVIMRPHYHTRRLTPGVIDRLVNQFGAHERFSLVEQMGETGSLHRSDVLVCDWSATAIEYALGLEKPVVFIDLPRRVRNPGWREFGIEPLEVSIRDQIGTVVPEGGLQRIPGAIERLLADRSTLRADIRALRERTVFNLGRSVARGAAEIARLAARASTEAEHRPA
jgi:CDP-glycerol glycerophosphotransferase (TagB/SpsB family)